MDGSGGPPPPPRLLRILSLDSLFEQNLAHPNFLQNILTINPVTDYNDSLYQLIMASQMEYLITASLEPPMPHLSPISSGIAVTAAASASASDSFTLSLTDVSGSSISTPPAVTAPATATAMAPVIIPWEERCLTLPIRGTIRLLTACPAGIGDHVTHLWDTDHTLTGWHARAQHDEQIAAVFFANQHRRWLAWKVWYRLTQRIWRRRTQCNVDMIDMAAVSDTDAILVTDTAHHMIYRFHRRDLFNTLLSNICMSDEMLPNPRAPRNPWTNAPFTYGQLVGVCQSLLQDYARCGKCPPVLFSAFWAAQFDVRRFASENASLLGQHAITAYFKDISDHNRETVADTIIQLLSEASVSCTPVGVRRWLRASPLTEGHRAWMRLACDYTLYMNLHVQVRPHWHGNEMIQRDVRRLHQRHPITDGASTRLRTLRSLGPGPGPGPSILEGPVPAENDAAMFSLLTQLFGPRTGPTSSTSMDDTLEHIQNSLFGGRGTGGHG